MMRPQFSIITRSSSTHPVVKMIPGEPHGHRLLIDYLSRRRPPASKANESSSRAANSRC